MKKEMKEWVGEKLHVFDNKKIGDGFRFGPKNRRVNVCVRLCFFLNGGDGV